MEKRNLVILFSCNLIIPSDDLVNHRINSRIVIPKGSVQLETRRASKMAVVSSVLDTGDQSFF